MMMITVLVEFGVETFMSICSKTTKTAIKTSID